MYNFFFLLSSLTLALLFLSSPLFSADSRSYLPRERSTKHLIVIDPGHGGSDRGATMGSIQEKTLTLKTARLIKYYLHKKGYQVILTRTQDGFISLTKRTNIANDTKSTIFISIHYNAFKYSHAKGVEVYYYNKGHKWRQKASKKLADLILSKMIGSTGAKNRGVKEGNFYVIRETCMPAVLIEGGFITNPQERSHLCDQKYLEKIAQSIASGIEKYIS